MTEWGVFNSEGCLVRQIWDRDEAVAVLNGPLYAEEPGAYVDEICSEHDEEPATYCEECWSA